jgi:hypothetical protein
VIDCWGSVVVCMAGLQWERRAAKWHVVERSVDHDELFTFCFVAMQPRLFT